MSVSSEVQRTLVKSPPELWAELSDPASLASHLGELGEIRIVRTVPESTVEWEAPEVTGRVQIKPSAWGTKVTLSVTGELPQTESQSPSEPSREISSPAESATPSPVAPMPASAAESGSTAQSHAESAPEAETESVGPADAQSAPAPELAVEAENVALSSSGHTPGGEPADPVGLGVGAPGHGVGSAPPEPEQQAEGVKGAGDPPESRPELAPRGRLLKRAWRRLRRLGAARPAPPPLAEAVPSDDSQPEAGAEATGEPPVAAGGPPVAVLSASEPGEERAGPEADAEATGEPPVAVPSDDPLPESGAVASCEQPVAAVPASESGEEPAGPEAGAVASGEQPVAVAPASESGEEEARPEPGTAAAGPAALATAESATSAQTGGPEDGELDGAAEQAATDSPDLGDLERHAAEQMTAVLMGMLDRLGAAHHRPFSRA